MEIIATNEAPKAIGPYSQAIRSGNTLYTSGQIALDPATGKLVDGDSPRRCTASSRISKPCSPPAAPDSTTWSRPRST